MATYKYPVTNKFQARAVTEPDFEPDLFADNLYVNLDEVRGNEFIQNIYFSLGINTETESLESVTDDYVKIIGSGHRGCGKTTELKKLHRYLNHPDRYFSVFLSIEEEMEYGAFQPEDLFIWIILTLVDAVNQRDIRIKTTALDQLATQLLSDKSIEKELKKSFQTELSAEAEAGFGFFKWLSFKTVAKAVFAGTNDTSTKIRTEVRRNTKAVIEQLNETLVDVREAIQGESQGGDLLFIVDGSEKLKFEIYEYLFVQNPNLLRSLSVNLIMSVPINSFYLIEETSAIDFPNQFIVPMIKLEKDRAHHCFREVIRRRLDEDTFFEPGVLDECVRVSGGCTRQLLIIVNTVIRRALGNRASLAVAQKAIEELGRRMYELLDTEHLTALRKGRVNGNDWQVGDEKVREMLRQLVLLKYNGTMKPNPLLTPFLTHDTPTVG